MLFLERFGKKIAIWFGINSLIGYIISIITGYMPIIVNVSVLITAIGVLMWDAASEIRIEQQKSFKEMMDKAFKIEEEKKDVDN